MRTRGDLINDDRAVGFIEELDAGGADDVELLEDAFGDFDGVFVGFGGDQRRGGGDVEDVIGVGVIEDSVVDEGTVEATGGYYREFPLKGHEGFEDAGLFVELFPGGG